MLKVAFSGKANSGKDTAVKFFIDNFTNHTRLNDVQVAALADPIKEMIRIMFPKTKHYILYGDSKHRSIIINGASLNDKPLTYRVLLQNLGTEVCRGYKESIWLDNMDFKIEKAESEGVRLFVISDVRFKNEFSHLKKDGFLMIRITRNSQLSLGHQSELEQEDIKDNEFDYIINNNSTLSDLKISINQVSKKLNIVI